jgi:hypothetical protein
MQNIVRKHAQNDAKTRHFRLFLSTRTHSFLHYFSIFAVIDTSRLVAFWLPPENNSSSSTGEFWQGRLGFRRRWNKEVDGVNWFDEEIAEIEGSPGHLGGL